MPVRIRELRDKFRNTNVDYAPPEIQQIYRESIAIYDELLEYREAEDKSGDEAVKLV